MNWQRSTKCPSVSVIIPAYNTAAYIGETLDSVFAQTFPDYEVIVVNDGSPDWEELARALEPYRGRLIYIEQENRGPGAARNTAISKARGQHLAFLDSDDIWLPDYLEKQMEVLREDPSLDLVYADAFLFGDSALAGLTFMQTSPSRGPVTFESLIRWECMIPLTCTVARRQPILDAGMFDESPLIASCEDFDLWLRLAYRGCRMGYHRQVLARHRLYATSLAANQTRMFTSKVAVLNKIKNSLPHTPSMQDLLAVQIARCEAHVKLEEGRRQFKARQFAKAAQTLERSNGFFKSAKLGVAVLCLRTAPRLLFFVYKARNRIAQAFKKLTA